MAAAVVLAHNISSVPVYLDVVLLPFDSLGWIISVYLSVDGADLSTVVVERQSVRF